jgi:hypothetical protein
VAGVSGEQQRRVEAALEALADDLLDRSSGPPPTRTAGRQRAAETGPTRPQRSSGHPATRAAAAPPAANDYPDPDE